MHVSRRWTFLSSLCIALLVSVPGAAVASAEDSAIDRDAEMRELRQTVHELAQRVSVLEERLRQQDAQAAGAVPETTASMYTASTLAESVAAAGRGGEPTSVQQVAGHPSVTPTDQQTKPAPWQLPGGATLNYLFDGYYGYNFNHPLGRVNYLRAYDVLSNAFSINQTGVVFALDPDVASGRRYGVRLDLQFGQATSTLQGNNANEPRPDIYRNIYQVYGTYVFPLGKGLTVDFGKWSSSLGAEGNYTKDQINYTRSFYFYFLPFYHAGLRANYKINDKIAVNYWLVNGTQQSEPTNSYKDELFGLELNPRRNISWTVNYYVGQDHPDSVPASNCTTPVQPGLCLAPVDPAPDGKQHIFDSYAKWNPTERWTFELEARPYKYADPIVDRSDIHVSCCLRYRRQGVRF